jgi:hypothetical protein
MMKNIFVLIFAVVFVASCETPSVVIHKDPSGTGGNSSSSTVASSSSSAESSASSSSATSGSSISSSSSGQGSGGNDPGLPCNPCADVNGLRIVRQRAIKTTSDGLYDVDKFGYWDSLRNESCNPSTMIDKTSRCIPTGYTIATNQFSDATCTTPLALGSANSCGSVPLKYAVTTIFTTDPCAPFYYEIYEVGALFAGQIYSKLGNNCTTSMPTNGYEYRTIGNKISPSEFAEVKTEYVH